MLSRAAPPPTDVVANWIGLFFVVFCAWQAALFIAGEYVNGARNWGLLATPQWLPQTAAGDRLRPVRALPACRQLPAATAASRAASWFGSACCSPCRGRAPARSGACRCRSPARATTGARSPSARAFLADRAGAGAAAHRAGGPLRCSADSASRSGWRAAPPLLMLGSSLAIAASSSSCWLPCASRWRSASSACSACTSCCRSRSCGRGRARVDQRQYVHADGSADVRDDERAAPDSGVTERMFDSLVSWFGRTPGGLAHASVGASAIFAAVSGSSIATAATLGRVACPEMTSRGYSPRLTYGVTAAGATLGIMIPPSIAMIIYGSTVGAPIDMLFIAGIVPGLLLAGLFMAAAFGLGDRACRAQRREGTLLAWLEKAALAHQRRCRSSASSLRCWARSTRASPRRPRRARWARPWPWCCASRSAASAGDAL